MKKERMTFFSVLLAVLVVVAVMGSFGVSLLMSDTAAVVWPTGTGGEGIDTPSASAGSLAGGYLVVGVTTETVQSVIATLDRPESHQRTLTVDYFWGQEGHGSVTVHAFVSGESSAAQVLSGGETQHSIVHGGTLYLWYRGDRSWYEGPAGESAADLMQRIPTYETVLALSKDDISAAGFVSVDGNGCIMVEAAKPDLGYIERYWIGVTSGLLLYAELEKDEKIVWRMSASSMEIPLVNENAFLLPSGRDVRG